MQHPTVRSLDDVPPSLLNRVKNYAFEHCPEQLPHLLESASSAMEFLTSESPAIASASIMAGNYIWQLHFTSRPFLVHCLNETRLPSLEGIAALETIATAIMSSGTAKGIIRWWWWRIGLAQLRLSRENDIRMHDSAKAIRHRHSLQLYWMHNDSPIIRALRPQCLSCLVAVVENHEWPSRFRELAYLTLKVFQDGLGSVDVEVHQRVQRDLHAGIDPQRRYEPPAVVFEPLDETLTNRVRQHMEMMRFQV